MLVDPRFDQRTKLLLLEVSFLQFHTSPDPTQPLLLPCVQPTLTLSEPTRVYGRSLSAAARSFGWRLKKKRMRRRRAVLMLINLMGCACVLACLLGCLIIACSTKQRNISYIIMARSVCIIYRTVSLIYCLRRGASLIEFRKESKKLTHPLSLLFPPFFSVVHKKV